MPAAPIHVALFASCPVDLFRPQAAFAAVKLLEQAGCRVSIPAQSCCGQIAFNNGAPDEARTLAWRLVTDFEAYDYVVVPSGSCGGMIRRHYPELFRDDSRLERVQTFCDRVFELTAFLADILDWRPERPNCDLKDRRIAYHDSCAGLRELAVRSQPRNLLRSCAGVEVTEMAETEVCCGFGGSFCMKFPDIANRMAEDKLTNALAVDPDYLVGGDVACLLHLAGKRLRQSGKPGRPEIRHVAELLAGNLDTAPMNGADGDGSGLS